MDSLVTSISLELSQQKANLARRSGSPAVHQVEPRFVLDTKPQQQRKRTSGLFMVFMFV